MNNLPIRVLSVTSQVPWPLNSGGHLRTFHIQKSLSRAFECNLIVPVRDRERPLLAQLEGEGINVVPVHVPDRSSIQEFRRLVRAWTASSPYSLYGRHYYSAVTEKLLKHIAHKKPTLLWLDHLDSFQYARQLDNAAVATAIDLHNIYSLIVKRLASENKNPIKRLFLNREASLLRNMEQRVCNGKHLLFAVSEDEAQHFRSLGAKHVHVAPNGTDTKKFSILPTGRDVQNLTVLFLGTMNWGPNVEAAKVLAEKVFPAIRRKIPNAKLLLVGKDPCTDVLALQRQQGISVVANVPDTLPYLQQATVMAVPLLSGGGTRLKILEAMASGLPVVSTPIGAEGLAVSNGEDIVLSGIDGMADAIATLSLDRDRMLSIAGEARRLVCATYDWNRIGEMCTAAIEQYVRSTSRR